MDRRSASAWSGIAAPTRPSGSCQSASRAFSRFHTRCSRSSQLLHHPPKLLNRSAIVVPLWRLFPCRSMRSSVSSLLRIEPLGASLTRPTEDRAAETLSWLGKNFNSYGSTDRSQAHMPSPTRTYDARCRVHECDKHNLYQRRNSTAANSIHTEGLATQIMNRIGVL